MQREQPSSITPEEWERLLRALDSGLSVPAACRRAGVDYAVWDSESERIPEFGTEAGRIETSGLEAAMRFLQQAAATEWRAALEYVKLYFALRGREVVRVDEPDGDLNTDVSPDEVAAVIRLLHANGLGGGAGDIDASAGGAEPVHPGSPNGSPGGVPGGGGG